MTIEKDADGWMGTGVNGPMAQAATYPAIPKQLAAKLGAIMRDTGYLKQKGRNSAQNYNYMSEEQLVSELRVVMNKHNVVTIPTVRDIRFDTVLRGNNKPPWTLATVKVSYKIIDGDTGEYTVAEMVGSGIDGGDKHVYKAITGANKYFLMKLFQIPSGDDPEKPGDWDRGDSETPPAAAQNAPKPTGNKKPAPGASSKEDGRAKAFRNAVDALVEEATKVGSAKLVTATVIRVLGTNGATKLEEITDSKARQAFVADLKEQLATLSKEE